MRINQLVVISAKHRVGSIHLSRLRGDGDAGDACAITLLLKILPFLVFVGILASLMFCSG